MDGAPAWKDEPICDYFLLMENTCEDHAFVIALLANFITALNAHVAALADAAANKNLHSLEFANRSLHAATASMCVPRCGAAFAEVRRCRLNTSG